MCGFEVSMYARKDSVLAKVLYNTAARKETPEPTRLTMNDIKVINLFAGKQPDGQSVVEQVRVVPTENDRFRLVQSPAFVQGLASGDEIRYDEKDNSFELVSHSGNLCLRVLARQGLELIRDNLNAELIKLGAELDYANERLLVYSIHVSCGFKEIEAVLNKHVGKDENSLWRYGNVYDPSDGSTPLNWWLDLDKDV